MHSSLVTAKVAGGLEHPKDAHQDTYPTRNECRRDKAGELRQLKKEAADENDNADQRYDTAGYQQAGPH